MSICLIGKGSKKVTFITLDNHFLATTPFFGKKCIFPFENLKTLRKFKKLVLEIQNVMHIATNAGHTAQNDGQTMQNDGRPRVMLAATHLMFAKDLPLYLKKL